MIKINGLPKLSGTADEIATAERRRQLTIEKMYRDSEKAYKVMSESELVTIRPKKEIALLKKLFKKAIDTCTNLLISDIKTDSRLRSAKTWNSMREVLSSLGKYDYHNVFDKYVKETKELTYNFKKGNVYPSIDNPNLTVKIIKGGTFVKKYNQKLITVKLINTGNIKGFKAGKEYVEPVDSPYGVQYFYIWHSELGKGYYFRANLESNSTKPEPKKKISTTKTVSKRIPKHGMTAKQIETAIQGMTKSEKLAYLDKLNRTLPENKRETTYTSRTKKSAYENDSKRKSQLFGWRLKTDQKRVYYEGRSSRGDTAAELTWHGTPTRKTKLPLIIGNSQTKTKRARE